MAFEMKTKDEELTELVDSYDESIAPYKIWRNDNNKIYLILKSIAAGFSNIRSAVLSLKNRFDPLYCADDDLESAMRIVGEKRIGGKRSIVRIAAVNLNVETAVTIAPGTLVFLGSSGERFIYTHTEALSIAGSSYALLLFMSEEDGAFPVSDASGVSVLRDDGLAMPQGIEWQTFENSTSLGRLEETNMDLRSRILSDTTRQDSLKELEQAIRALPSIYACNLIFNPSHTEYKTLEDNTELGPKELLILLTGAVPQDLADIVMSHTVYKTKKMVDSQVVYYYNDVYLGGKAPVYYEYHKQRHYHITIYYTFDRTKRLPESANADMEKLLLSFKNMMTWVPEITEPMLYKALDNHGIPGVEIKKIYLQDEVDGNLESVATVHIPRLSLPYLSTISFVPEDRT